MIMVKNIELQSSLNMISIITKLVIYQGSSVAAKKEIYPVNICRFIECIRTCHRNAMNFSQFFNGLIWHYWIKGRAVWHAVVSL